MDQRPGRIHRKGGTRSPAYVVTLDPDALEGFRVTVLERKRHLIAEIMVGGPDSSLTYRQLRALTHGPRRRSIRITFEAVTPGHGGRARADEVVDDLAIEQVCAWTSRDFVEDFASLYAAARGMPLSRVDQ